jgi:hypothetical protein
MNAKLVAVGTALVAFALTGSAAPPRLGLATGDELPLYKDPEGTQPTGDLLFQGAVVKIVGQSPDGKMLRIESELGKGWIPAQAVREDFDRRATLAAYESNKGMAWFFERFNQGTGYETMSFENQAFSPDELRALIGSARGANDHEREIAQVVLVRALLRGDAKDPKVRHFSKALKEREFWATITSRSRDFWAGMPDALRADRKLVLDRVPHGAWLIYDLLPKKLRDDAELAKATFEVNPESLQFASARLRDDEAVVGIAALQNPMVLQHASARLLDDEPFLRRVAQGNPMALQFMSGRLRKNAAFVLFLCGFRPWALQYASPELLDDAVVFESLAARNPMVIRLASQRLQAHVPLLKKMYSVAPDTYKKPFYDAFPAPVRHQIDSP